MKLFLLSICLFLLSLLPNQADAYSREKTHRLINEQAIRQSSVDQFLKGYLSFVRGLDEVVDSREVFQWVRQGGRDEDDPSSRGVYHFHDPTKAWDEAGILGIAYSSLQWAQDHTTGLTPNCQALNIQCPETSNPEWSWPAARNYFYTALTSTDPTVRDQKFGRTFLTLGHVMHLLADAAVPEHTRNDQHMMFPFGSRYEDWNENNQATLASFPLTAPVDYLLVTAQSAVAGYIPISNFWDTTPATGVATLLGLAEYTNYNFLSPGTIFKVYANPAKPQETARYVEDVISEDSKVDKRIYYRATTSDNRNIEHFVSMGLLWDDLEKISPIGREGMQFVLDDRCYKDYASILVPRAESYDAGLLNFFFRGTLDVSWPETFVYSVADGSQTPYTDANGHQHQQFTKLKASILNTTPNEAIAAGTLTAVARYKIIPNYAPDLSNYPPDSLTMKDVQYSYSVSQVKTLTDQEAAAMNAGYQDFTFDFTGSPIPAGITDLTLQVVFKGTLGNEVDNAIAVGMKDLMEPTHLTFWNLSDMFSLQYPGSDYNLYTFASLQQMAQPGTSLLNFLDDTGDDSLNDELYLQPNDMIFTISFWNGVSMSPAVTANIPAGGHIRLIVLSGQSTNNWYELKWDEPGVRNSQITLQFPGVVNQADPSGAYGTMTPLYTLRNGYAADGALVPILQHDYAGIVGCKPDLGGTYCPYAKDQAFPASLTPVPFTSSAFN